MREPVAETLLKHADFLRSLARSILRDEQAAEDVAQEALMAAVRRPGVRAWLGAVARNLAVSRLRADRRRARRERAAARPEAHGNVPEAVARLEAQQRVVEAVLALDAPYRAVVLERFFYDRAMPDVAERLGVPVATARTRLRRALATLKARLERRMGPAAMIGALALLARPALAAALTGAIVMSTKTKVAAVLALVALVAWVLLASRTSPDTVRDGIAARVAAADAPDPPAGTAGDAIEATGPLLTGRCVDSWDARPVEGARVHAGEIEAVTDASGRFSVRPHEGLTAVVTSKEGYLDGVASLPSAGMDLGDVLMKPGVVLRGIVLTPAGQPAAGATVLVLGTRYEPPHAVATSNAAGRFSIPVPEAVTAPGPIAQEMPLQVAAHLAGYVEAVEAVTDPDAELRLVLCPARTVRGIVVDAGTGLGVPGAELSVPIVASQPARIERWRVGVSGDDGTFAVELPPLPERAGSIVPGLLVGAAGYAPCHLGARAVRPDGNRVVLEPSTVVHGRLVHGDGRAAPGIPVVSYRAHVPGAAATSPEAFRLAEARLRALEAEGRSPPKLDVDRPPCTRTVSGDSGEFTVEVSRMSPFRIEADKWPLAGSVEMFSVPDEAVTIVVTPRADFRLLRVRVLDAQGRPVSGASVLQANLGAAANPLGRGPAGQPTFRTGANGYADVGPSGGKEGALFVAWSTDWVGVSKMPVYPQSPDAGTPEVVCEPAGTVRGRVVGAPLHHGARASLWWTVGDVPWRMQSVRVGRDGRFMLPGAPAGRCTVVVADPGGRSALVELDLGPCEARDLGALALDPPAVVEGVIRMDGGEPGADAMVRWQPVAPYERSVFADSYWETLRADANGAFSIPVWSRGPVRVSAQGGPFTVVPEGAPHGGQKIPFGKTVDVECRPGDGPLTIEIPPGR